MYNQVPCRTYTIYIPCYLKQVKFSSGRVTFYDNQVKICCKMKIKLIFMSNLFLIACRLFMEILQSFVQLSNIPIVHLYIYMYKGTCPIQFTFITNLWSISLSDWLIDWLWFNFLSNKFVPNIKTIWEHSEQLPVHWFFTSEI